MSTNESGPTPQGRATSKVRASRTDLNDTAEATGIHLEENAVRLIAAVARHDVKAFNEIADASGHTDRRLMFTLARLARNGLTRDQWLSLARTIEGREAS